MELGLREWLIIFGIIVIAAILFDGWRRLRGSRSKLRLDRNLSSFYDNTTEADTFNETIADKIPTLSSITEGEDDLVFSPNKNSNSKTAKSEPQISLNLNDEPSPAAKTSTAKSVKQPDSKPQPIEEILVLNVVALSPEGFKGPALLQNILESGLRFGEMDIFHRHESMTGNGERYFSMANGVKPGTFDLDDIDHFSTRAVSFFLGLPGPKHPKRAFDVMLAAARKLTNELNGELQDDQHSVMTPQTIEHYRQRIVDFERRKLKHKY